MRLYEEAIQSARANGFVQNEAVAHELAQALSCPRSMTAGRTHMERRAAALAAGCRRQGQAAGRAHGATARRAASSSAISLTNVAQLDLLSVAKAPRHLRPDRLEDLVDTLMRIVLENAGAQTGHLLLARSESLVLAPKRRRAADDPCALAPGPGTARIGVAGIYHQLRPPQQGAGAARQCDAIEPFSTDDYFARRRPRSVLCLPIMRRSALIGRSTWRTTWPRMRSRPNGWRAGAARIQAAISLENALLYTDLRQENSNRKRAEEALREREGRIRRLVESNIIGVFFWTLPVAITDANDAFLHSVATRGKIYCPAMSVGPT